MPRQPEPLWRRSTGKSAILGDQLGRRKAAGERIGPHGPGWAWTWRAVARTALGFHPVDPAGLWPILPFTTHWRFDPAGPPGFRLCRTGAPTLIASSETLNPRTPSTKGIRKAKRFRPAGVEPLDPAGAKRRE